MSATQPFYVLSLGEIVRRDISKTIAAFAALLQAKNSHETIGSLSTTLGKKFLPSAPVQAAIEAFKLGSMESDQFSATMIGLLVDEFHCDPISAEEFKAAWNAGNPILESINPHLSLLNQQYLFISDTNLWDIEHLQAVLGKRFETVDAQTEIKGPSLFYIDKIPLFCSYIHGQQKPELLQLAKKQVIHDAPLVLLLNKREVSELAEYQSEQRKYEKIYDRLVQTVDVLGIKTEQVDTHLAQPSMTPKDLSAAADLIRLGKSSFHSPIPTVSTANPSDQELKTTSSLGTTRPS